MQPAQKGQKSNSYLSKYLVMFTGILTGLKGDIQLRKYCSDGGSVDGLKQGAKQIRVP